MYQKALKIWIAFLTSLLVLRRTFSQDTTVTCVELLWANNSLGQSPCKVASYLMSVCYSGVYTIGPLDPGTVYGGSFNNGDGIPDSCLCSSVVYSLYSACGACQNLTYMSWATWSGNCSTVYYQEYPNHIPEGTAVPGWAYLDIYTVGGGFFNATAAQEDLSAPQSTGSMVQPTTSEGLSSATSVTTSIHNSSMSTTANTIRSSMTSSSTNTPSSSPIRVITGGVVGGVAGSAIIVTGVMFLMRRRAIPHDKHALLGELLPVSPPMGQTIFQHHFNDIVQDNHRILYNPDDPSTFPRRLLDPSTTYINQVSGLQPGIQPLSFQANLPRPGTYTGVAEI